MWTGVSPGWPSSQLSWDNVAQQDDKEGFVLGDAVHNEIFPRISQLLIQQKYVPCSLPCVMVFQMKAITLGSECGSLLFKCG
jgi:hypothetical protein